jgi:hypothetical protein
MSTQLNYSIGFLFILSTYFSYCWSNNEEVEIAIHEASGTYSPSSEAINFLKSEYPKDNFPVQEWEYYCNKEKIRLNPHFCKAIKRSPELFNGFKVYKINKIALFFPECFEISCVDGSEKLSVNEEKIRLRICEQKIESFQAQQDKANIAIAVLLNDDSIKNKEKVNTLRLIFQSNQSDKENNADNKIPLVVQLEKPKRNFFEFIMRPFHSKKKK